MRGAPPARGLAVGPGEPGAADWKVGVNLARQQLRGDGLAEEVRGCLDTHGIDAASLHLEVTETEVMSDPAAASAALAAVRALGVSVDMDDFGTGHSSLACLDRFPLDVLKIDRSFVADLEDDPRRVAMLSAVARLADDLDIDIVAEGIETADQLARSAASAAATARATTSPARCRRTKPLPGQLRCPGSATRGERGCSRSATRGDFRIASLALGGGVWASDGGNPRLRVDDASPPVVIA